ncbi:MAG: hypothetical protein SF052_14295 [Bacteroidia bacterium]|nr:hypothetical protein [Bacteroidia bacterium]
MFRTFDHSKGTYLRAILHSLDLSRVINQTAHDLWYSYDLLPDAGSPDILIALADVQGLPQVHYLISDSALIRVEAERKDTLQGIKARVYPRAMTLYDSSRQFYQTFFLPERSFAIRP